MRLRRPVRMHAFGLTGGQHMTVNTIASGQPERLRNDFICALTAQITINAGGPYGRISNAQLAVMTDRALRAARVTA